MEDNKKTVDQQEEIIDENTTDKVETDLPQEDTVEILEADTKENEETSEKEKESDKAAEYLDRLQRLMAEFDNYRKRSEKEKIDNYDYAVSNTIVDLLPIVDNFERALKVETTDPVFYEGVTMIYKQLLGAFENAKVLPIAAVGETFDPNLHNAILHIDDESYGENMVVEELQKGYLYKEKVIRHSMVKVAN